MALAPQLPMPAAAPRLRPPPVAERRPIRMGATSVSAVEIQDGVKEGDKVVVAGADAFDNAERVSINQ